MKIYFYLCTREDEYSAIKHMTLLYTTTDAELNAFIIKNMISQMPCILTIDLIKKMKRKIKLMLKEDINNIPPFRQVVLIKNMLYGNLYYTLDFMQGILTNPANFNQFIRVEM